MPVVFRPTMRAVVLCALCVPAALAVVTLLPRVWYVSLYAPALLLALMAVDLVPAAAGRRLAVAVHTPPRIHVGATENTACRITLAGFSGPLALEVLLEISGDAVPPESVHGVLENGVLECAIPLTPTRRGVVGVDALWLRWQGSLGLVAAHSRHPVASTVDVVPNVRGIHEAALQFFSRDAVFGTKTQRMRGEGTEFDALCDYSQGMDSRFIDWKRSARHRKLLCKEFRQERNHQVVLGLDTGHLMLEPINAMPRLDHAIRAGLLLGRICLHSGDYVGGCAFDSAFRSFLRPGRGMPFFTHLQKFTASLAYRPEETNFTLALAELESRLQRRALVVLFTEFVDTVSVELLLESLHRMARRHVVVFVTMSDPILATLQNAPPKTFLSAAQAVLADDFLRERAIVLERIARLGVHCIDTRAEGISTALLNRYLMVKQRGLL